MGGQNRSVCQPRQALLCTSINQCPYGQLCTSSGECVLQNCSVATDCTWPATVCQSGFCAQECIVSESCPPGYECFRDADAGSQFGGCVPSPQLSVTRLSSQLSGLCNSTFTFPNETLGCLTFNEAGVYWATNTGSNAAIELTLVVPAPQVKQFRLKGRGRQWVVDPYNPFGVGIVFHRPREMDRVIDRVYDDYAKPGLLTLDALSKEIEKFAISDPKARDENRWSVVHAEMSLSNRFIREVQRDVFNYPVELTVYLQIFYNTMELQTTKETIYYTLLRWFGDATAVAGFLTGLTLWSGISFTQAMKRPSSLID